MPQTIDRAHLRAVVNANPHATYAELASLSGCCESTVARIVRYEFRDERRRRLTVVADFDDFRAGASFALGDFLASCWIHVWPCGLRVFDSDGEVYEVRGWLRKRTWRQRLVGTSIMIEPVNCNGMSRRVSR